MEMWQVKRFDELKATGQLPSPKGIALKVLKIADNEGAGMAEIARVIQGDPALAGRILKLVNSAFYAGRNPITAVSDAVTRLGLRIVLQVALGFSVISNYRRGLCRHFDYDRFWSHSLATGVSAQWLSASADAGKPEEAFTCGLMSQIGRLGLASIFPSAYDKVLAAAIGQPDAELLSLEQQAFAMDHRELTAAMLQDWGIEGDWVSAVRYHEDPTASDLPPGETVWRRAMMLNTATCLGMICSSENGDPSLLIQDLFARAGRLKIAGETLVPVCNRSVREWATWGEYLGVKTRELPPFESAPGTVSGTDAANFEEGFASGNEAGDLRVLIVDGDPRTSELVQRFLPQGSKIVTVSAGHDALPLAVDLEPHIIFIDWTVSGTSGIDLCRTLRMSKTGQRMHVFAMPREYDESLISKALEAGANEFIIKPILPGILEARVGSALRVIRLQEEVIKDREAIRQNLVELAVLNRKLEQAALTDFLTGLPNRRYALDRLAQEWSASVRTGSPLSCLLLDLDHFKRVNDVYGHDAGDLVLREIAGVLRQSVRASDVVCRIGGEEFLVVCRDANSWNAGICGERLRQKVEAHRVEASGTEVRITISIGIATRGPATPDIDSLLKRADIAAYASKKGGRNRVTLAD